VFAIVDHSHTGLIFDGQAGALKGRLLPCPQILNYYVDMTVTNTLAYYAVAREKIFSAQTLGPV
jgi:hypothetical protein